MAGRLAQALEALKDWQDARTLAQRRGWCLGATRAALTEVSLRLPAAQPAPNNTARWNGFKLADDPARWGWVRIAPTSAAFGGLRLDYFDGVARLPDGRIAGHVGITDPETGIIHSAVDFDWNANWARARMASFVPLSPTEGAPLGFLTPLEDQLDAPSVRVMGIAVETGPVHAPPQEDPAFEAFAQEVNGYILSDRQILDAEQ